MINWFRNIILNRIYLNSIKKSRPRNRRKYGTEIKSISVILDHELGVEKEYFKNMAELFDLSKKNIRVLTYYQSSKKIGEERLNSSYTFKDITNLGKINDVLNDFCAKKSDILINYYNKNELQFWRKQDPLINIKKYIDKSNLKKIDKKIDRFHKKIIKNFEKFEKTNTNIINKFKKIDIYAK